MKKKGKEPMSRWKKAAMTITAVAALLMSGVSTYALPVSNGVMTNEDITRLEPVERDWTAQWIWTEDNTSQHNWICLRKEFLIDSEEAMRNPVIAMIAADSRYWLWINGEIVVREGSVKRGPTEEDTYLDYVDITSHLHEGSNTIAAAAWFYGSDGDYYSYRSSGEAGFLFEAELGDGTVIASDATWKAMTNSGYRISTEENNSGSQSNYRLAEGNILYDAQEAGELIINGIESWMEPEYDDSTWPGAIVYGNAGNAPWNDLYERSIPQLRYSELREYENPEVYAAYTDAYTTAETTLQLELPTNLQMNPVLEIDAREGGLKIDMTSSGVSTAVRASYITTEGYQKWECPGWMSSQYLTVTIPAGVRVIGLYYYESGYDTEQAGSFVCDDDELNQIWQECYDTLVICMRDTFMDCPDRERAQWWGDVTSQMQEMFYTLSESSSLLYRKGVDSVIGFTENEDEDDAFYHVLRTVVPTNKSVIELPQQELYGIVGFWTYYLYTGETDFLEEVYEPAVNYLRLWNMGEDGLVVHRAGTMDWADWGKNADSAILENAWYYWALNTVKDIAGVIGRTEDLTFLDERSSSIKDAFDKSFWKNGAYYNETKNEEPDDRAQAIAVLSGLAESGEYQEISDIFLTVRNSSPYMENFVLMALFKMGYENEALIRMKQQYASFLTDEWKTVGEFFEKNLEGMKPEDIELYYNPSHNHAWSSGPLVHLGGYAAGIYPTEPGYEAWHVIPQLGLLRQIRTTVPSAKGEIVLSIEKNEDALLEMDLTSPGGTCEVWVPVAEGQSAVQTEGAKAQELGIQSAYGNTYAVFRITEEGTYHFTAQ